MMRERITSTSTKTKERRKRFFIKIVWSLFGLVLFLIGLAFLSTIDSLQIKEIYVSGNEILSEDEIKKETSLILSKKRFLVFSGTNRLIYSKNKLEESLKKTFPRILSLSISLEEKKLKINILERERAYLWCGAESSNYEDISNTKECFFLDSGGFIFDTSPSFSSGVYFTFYSNLEDGDPIGQTILNHDFLKDIELLIIGLSENNFPIHSLFVKEDGQYELLLNMPNVLNMYSRILFTEDHNLSEVYNKVISVVEDEPFKTDFTEKPNQLEYIDARFKNRIFYKFTD